MKVISRSCFAMEPRELGKHLLGNGNYSKRGKELVLTGYDGSSLVVDRLCDQTRGQNTPISCFYFDFATRKEQSVTSMLGSLLEQIVGGMEKIPEEISRAFQDRKLAIGGRGP